MTFTSIFAGLAKAEHSTMAWLEKGLVAFVQDEPKIEQVIDAGLSYVGPVLVLALDGLGQEATATVAEGVIVQAHNDLQAASALVTDFGPTPTAASIFAAVEKNLGALLTAGHVTSATSVAAVKKAVNEVGVLGAAVSTAVANIAAATKTPAPATPASGSTV
jgi:hypothetical protein